MSKKIKSYNHVNLCHKVKKFKEENEICLDFTFRNNQFISAKRFHESMSPIQISSSHPIPFEEKVNISIKPKSLKSLIIPSPLVLNIKKGNNEELLLNDISLKNYSSTNSEENGTYLHSKAISPFMPLIQYSSHLEYFHIHHQKHRRIFPTRLSYQKDSNQGHPERY